MNGTQQNAQGSVSGNWLGRLLFSVVAGLDYRGIAALCGSIMLIRYGPFVGLDLISTTRNAESITLLVQIAVSQREFSNIRRYRGLMLLQESACTQVHSGVRPPARYSNNSVQSARQV